MERTIRVTGRGKISVAPDVIRLQISLEDVCDTYDQTLKQSTVQTEMLKDCFQKIGFKRSDLKTTSFNVDTEYESYQDKERNWQRRFLGYKFSHSFKIEFDSDNQKLGQVLYALAHCPIHPEFRIIYTIKDIESAKNELLSKAICDSKTKAEVLTKAAGVKLGEIKNIDYSWGEIDIISSPMNKLMEPCMALEDSCARSYDMDIEPDDIDVTDTVTVVWEIE